VSPYNPSSLVSAVTTTQNQRPANQYSCPELLISLWAAQKMHGQQNVVNRLLEVSKTTPSASRKPAN
jgi:hypothetical protein